MFPEIVRDDVFRIESRRLWLRWPTLADAFDGRMVPQDKAGLQAEPIGAGFRLPAAACVLAWRADAERGVALHFVLEEKTDARSAIGTLRLTQGRDGSAAIDFHLAPNRRGHGLMTEAVQAVVHTAFLQHWAPVIAAAPTALDREGRGVLERCGFTYVGSGMRDGPSPAGLVACDRFQLDRRTWRSLRGWGMPERRLRHRSETQPPVPGLGAVDLGEAEFG